MGVMLLEEHSRQSTHLPELRSKGLERVLLTNEAVIHNLCDARLAVTFPGAEHHRLLEDTAMLGDRGSLKQI